MQISFTQGKHQFKLEDVSREAFQLFRNGKYCEGLESPDFAMKVTVPTVDQYYVKSLMVSYSGQFKLTTYRNVPNFTSMQMKTFERQFFAMKSFLRFLE